MTASLPENGLPLGLRTALVLGLGSSGEAAARLLRARGVRVTVLDAAAGAAQEARAASLEAGGVVVRLGPGGLPAEAYGLCVVSPGIRSDDPWVLAARAGGVPVWGEIELGWRLCRSRVLAVTGSNGKSTLVKLCRDALRTAGLTAEIAGNYGPPLCAIAGIASPPDWLVVEVSSFQLETVEAFCPDVGILLNFNPNHLDRHGSLAVYGQMKARLFARMGAAQTAVLPADVPAWIGESVPAACGRRTFGGQPGADAVYADGAVIIRGRGPFDLVDTAFGNEVMGITAAACMAALDSLGLDPACVAEGARSFERLPHRMETVTKIRGVEFVDDSKATNLAALSAGLSMARGPVRLIAGGLLKEHDLEPAKKRLVNRARGVYIIGKSAQEMASAWQDVVPCCICRDLNEAVHRAWKEASTGEVVLLSPGCASFDQFRSFEDRGDQFKSIVRGLKEE